MIEQQPVSSTEESELAKSSSNLPIVDLKNYNIAKKTIRFIQINHVIDKPNSKNSKAEQNLKETEFNFMIDLKTLTNKTSVDLELLQLTVCVLNKQKDRVPDEFSSVLSKTIKRFSLLFAGETLGDVLYFGHSGSRNMLVEIRIFCWLGIKKNIENKCSTCAASMSPGKILKYQLPSTEKTRLPTLTEPGQETKNPFDRKSHNKYVTGEPYIFIEIDRYSKWPVVRICKSSETKEVINFLESFMNF